MYKTLIWNYFDIHLIVFMFQLLLDLITYPVQDADMDHIGLIANIYFHPKLSSGLDHIKERYLIGSRINKRAITTATAGSIYGARKPKLV